MTTSIDQAMTELQHLLADATEQLDVCRALHPKDQQAIAACSSHVQATRRAITVVQNVIDADFADRVRSTAEANGASRLPGMLQTAKAELDDIASTRPTDYRAIGMSYMRVRSIKRASDIAGGN